MCIVKLHKLVFDLETSCVLNGNTLMQQQTRLVVVDCIVYEREQMSDLLIIM